MRIIMIFTFTKQETKFHFQNYLCTWKEESNCWDQTMNGLILCQGWASRVISMESMTIMFLPFFMIELTT